MGKLRELEDGARYHVVARTDSRGACFGGLDSVELVYAALAEAKSRFGFSLEGFCLFADRLDLFIRPGEDAGLPEIMRWLLGTIAARYNRSRGLAGRLWRSRYSSRIL